MFPECPSGSCSEADEDETECVSSEDEKDGLLLISPRSDRCSLCIMRRRAMVSVAGGGWGDRINLSMWLSVEFFGGKACARLDVMVLPRRSLVGWLACPPIGRRAKRGTIR